MFTHDWLLALLDPRLAGTSVCAGVWLVVVTG
jgi:hypothetical protein